MVAYEEINELFTLMEDFPAVPCPGPSLLESPDSPTDSATTEELSAFGAADFESSCLDMDLPAADAGGLDSPLVVSLTASPKPKAKRAAAPKAAKPSGGGARKRGAADGAEGGEGEGEGSAAASEEEARKAQRMARNRRAAATSRARKKEHLETLQAQVERLEAENAELRRRLSDAGLASDEPHAAECERLGGEALRGSRPYGQQPAALCWTSQPPQLGLTTLPTPPRGRTLLALAPLLLLCCLPRLLCCLRLPRHCPPPRCQPPSRPRPSCRRSRPLPAPPPNQLCAAPQGSCSASGGGGGCGGFADRKSVV